jgi:hypothetical protein
MITDVVDVECQQDYDTKDCIVRLTTASQSHDTRLTMEDLQDRDWRQIVRTSINSAGILVDRHRTIDTSLFKARNLP